MQRKKITFDSICVHDVDKAFTTTPHQLPIYATSAFEFEDITEGMDIFEGTKTGHVYTRYGNPTIESVARKIAKLEALGSDIDVFGMMTSSGMAAISTMITGLFEAGDGILTQTDLYGGTSELITKVFKKRGVKSVLQNLKDLSAVGQLLDSHKNIKGIYLESPTNPTLSCVDLKAIAEIAKSKGVITMIDNTFATPYLQQPLLYGIDLVIHSTTKYLNGHGNAVTGIIIGDKKFHKPIWSALKLIGTNCNPFDAWLVNNGIKTLSLRMDRHCDNAMRLAQFLDAHSKIKKVNYIGLPSHPDHALAGKQMKKFGGMMSFELDGDINDTIRFMNRIKFCAMAPTLGNVDTLIVHPATMSHRGIAKAIREQNGITDSLVRLSVGIEGYEDIEGDLAQALNG